jgi:hypothetical protein
MTQKAQENQWKRRQALGLLGSVAVAAVSAHAAAPARERIVGLYKLAKVVRRTADGQETVTNANPTGRISYDRSGRVWVLLAPAERKAAADQRNMTMDDYQEMARGLMGYFGTYEVDEAKKKLIIHLEAAANPALTGTTIEREYVLTDTTLTMIVPGNPATLNVFERLPD